MLKYLYYSFFFKYLNKEGKKIGVTSSSGVMDDKGIWFDDSPIYYEDIYQVSRQRNDVIIQLYPAITVSAQISSKIIQGTAAIIIRTTEEAAFQIKSKMDQRITSEQTKQRERQMLEERRLRFFKVVRCPRCESHIDLSYKGESKYVYCPYCELLFNNHRQVLPNTENYKLCPQCEYFNRVQDYPEMKCYFYGTDDYGFGYERQYCCDTCAEHNFRENTLRNLPFFLGLPINFYVKAKQMTDTNSGLQDMTMANFHAQKGNIETANEIYQGILLHYESYPGLHYNMGKAYLDLANAMEQAERQAEEPNPETIIEAQKLRQKGVAALKKSLQFCCNFKPTFDLLQKYKEYQYIIPEERKDFIMPAGDGD